MVPPAAEIPRVAKAYRATVAKINLEEISLTRQASDYSILGPYSTMITEIVKRVKAKRE